MKYKIALILLLGSTVMSSAYAQTNKKTKKIVIQGVVVDRNQEPIANAIVFIDGKNTNKTSNGNGLFKLKVKPSVKTITIVTPDQGGVEYQYRGEKKITFVMDTAFNVKQAPFKDAYGDEMVNTGYGKTKKKNLTQSVGQVSKNRMKEARYYSNIYEMIKGEVPGVTVSGTSIRIRGASSIMASNEPLFVVNDSPVNSISGISPHDVKSINILKGSAAAIYGSRGTNGVIVIELKSAED